MTFGILTDSSSNLPEEIIDQYDLQIMSLEFNVEGAIYRSYLKGDFTDLKQFYDMMREGKVILTSLARIEDAEKLLREQFDAGRDVLYLGFDSALSGTYDMISTHIKGIAAAEYPERTLFCVDTKAAALGMGRLVLEAAQRRDKGESLEAVAQWAQEHLLTFAHWFTVDDLNFLQRGGRLSKGVAVAGTMLNIKPVLHIDAEGKLVPVDKVRGRKKSLMALVDKFGETAAEPKAEQFVAISHGDCLEEAQFVADSLKEKYGVSDILIHYLDPVIAAHSGPGTVALFFTTDGER
ncbi:MAG: DegV family protein [Coriobacteriales bacterium]|jgi:DegV family protein with EDD domain|nr:DegV family protein [Coriobacteriales bacterium]